MAQTPDEWAQVWRRVITTTPTKAVGYAAASFANWERGDHVRPGNELLARICGCSTKSVERAFAFIRDHELMWRYHMSRCQGESDEYRLTIPEDINKLPLLTPDWDRPPDSQSAPDSQSGADTESGAGADPVQEPVHNQLPEDAPPPDSQSGPDSQSRPPDSQSVTYPTQGRPTSTRNLSQDLYNHANTSPATAGVEGGGDPAGAENSFTAPPKCGTCGGSAQPAELDRNGGNCRRCAPALADGLDAGLVAVVSKLNAITTPDPWPPPEPEDAAC